MSQHLALLRKDGLVAARRDAQTIYYSIASEPAREVLKTLYQVYCAPPKAGKPKARASYRAARDGALRQVNATAANFREIMKSAAVRVLPTRCDERCVQIDDAGHSRRRGVGRAVWRPPKPSRSLHASVADEKAVFATVESISVVPARGRIGGIVVQLNVREGDPVTQRPGDRSDR